MKKLIFITLLIIFAQGCKDKDKEEKQIIPSSKKSDCEYYITVKTSNGIDTTYELCNVNNDHYLDYYTKNINIKVLYPYSELYPMNEYNAVSFQGKNLVVGEEVFEKCYVQFTYKGDYYTNFQRIDGGGLNVENNSITLDEYLPNNYVKGHYSSIILDENNNTLTVKGNFYIDISSIANNQ